MANYQLLEKFKYSIDKSVTRNEGLDEEYKKRLSGYSTILTQIRPKLFDSEFEMSNDYPLFLVETSEINRLNTQVYRNSQRIQQLANLLPEVAQGSFVNSLVVKEVHFTNEIEGVETDPEEIGTIVGDLSSNVEKRLKSTINLYIDTINRKVIKIHQLSDIRNIYDELLDGEIPKSKQPDGVLFRNSQVRIGSSMKTVHIPPTTESEIRTELTSLIEFMNRKEIDPIIKAVMTHFVFENTHPFKDGNGRLGRYLISSYLASKVDIFTALSISGAIRENRSKYYKAFQVSSRIENRADNTIFVRDMLEILVSGQLNVIDDLTDKKDTIEIVAQNLDGLNQFENLEKRILFLLAQSKLFAATESLSITDNEIFAVLKSDGFAKAKSQRAIREMVKSGDLVETLGRPLKHAINNDIWRLLTKRS